MTEVSTTDAENQDNLDPQSTDQQTANSDNLATSNNDQGTTDNDTATANSDEGKDDQGSKTPATFDDDLDDWISKRGLKAETEEEKQSLQDLRNGQREYTREQQAKKDSESLATSLAEERKGLKTEDDDDESDDPLEVRLRAVEADRNLERTTRLQSEFYSENKVSDAEHKAILDIIKEKVARPSSKEGKLQALDIWSSPDALPDLLDLAKARVFKSSDTSSTEEAAVKAERERIAKESNANSSPRGAKTTTTGDKTAEQQRLERFSQW